MNLTSRSRYALKIMLDLAQQRHEPLVRRQEIVGRQGIPSKYLDQILVKLRRAGLVESVRGRTGGYRIGRDVAAISVWEVFRAVEDGIYPVECVDERHLSCEHLASCGAAEPWQLIFATLRRSLETMPLSSLEASFSHTQRISADKVLECRPGREPLRMLTDESQATNLL